MNKTKLLLYIFIKQYIFLKAKINRFYFDQLYFDKWNY